MTVDWFIDDVDRIVETSWGRFQDTPIFRSLAREHNTKITHRNGGYIPYDGPPVMATLLPGEEVIYKGDPAFRKARLIDSITASGWASPIDEEIFWEED